jgi:hypothetical protein
MLSINYATKYKCDNIDFTLTPCFEVNMQHVYQVETVEESVNTLHHDDKGMSVNTLHHDNKEVSINTLHHDDDDESVNTLHHDDKGMSVNTLDYDDVFSTFDEIEVATQSKFHDAPVLLDRQKE